jgi:hypothetical protein
MKKIILSAVLLLGVGVATSQAGVSFGISIDNGRYTGSGYVASDCAPAPVYSQPGCPPQAQSGYYSGGFRDGHELLHRDLREERADLHHDIRQARQAVHRQLKVERAYGVPHRVRAEQLKAANRVLREQHREGHYELRGEHRAGHYELGW